MKYYIKRNDVDYCIEPFCNENGDCLRYAIFNDKDNTIIIDDNSRKRIKKHLRKLNTYDKYQKHLDYLMNEDR